MAGSRKSELKALFSGSFTPSAPPSTPSRTEGDASVFEKPAPPARAASGAVKAMGLSLGAIAKDAEEVRALRQALTGGDHVVSVSTDQIDASFVEDRLQIDQQDDDDFQMLMDSMRESGQQVPVLLRPHPAQEGRYQTAYGHRRIRAAARLGIPVKAVVKPMTDDELVMAQGKENAERRNLSFIERAIFARNLAARGFDRKVIGSALSVQKSELSRLIQVIEAVPETYIRMIGAAPKAGRDRWMKLGDLLKSEAGKREADRVIAAPDFRSSGSDQRFQLLFDNLTRPKKPMPETDQAVGVLDLKDHSGRVFARLKRDGRSSKIEFVSDVDDAFLNEAARMLVDHFNRYKGA
ncbi:plasmid partitioning protein RepB [Rhizobium sp. SSA_523]|uniref:plasmid partitioning protein RepB n=1 Tax=Rhizobium sp. SSA_523 TaxID=2952477 RepID=UPI00209184A8|nr:plasmid partitioning protein RepB [Rhizobium sp. SSA_523]MCO5732243.1 plasmid partitioning protein RepB [Rhizobium sp. SSA_523]WKC21347.1 plasmid partitioning protein RepB [Rhizobium sp. SSA_523]